MVRITIAKQSPIKSEKGYDSGTEREVTIHRGKNIMKMIFTLDNKKQYHLFFIPSSKLAFKVNCEKLLRFGYSQIEGYTPCIESDLKTGRKFFTSIAFDSLCPPPKRYYLRYAWTKGRTSTWRNPKYGSDTDARKEMCSRDGQEYELGIEKFYNMTPFPINFEFRNPNPEIENNKNSHFFVHNHFAYNDGLVENPYEDISKMSFEDVPLEDEFEDVPLDF